MQNYLSHRYALITRHLRMRPKTDTNSAQGEHEMLTKRKEINVLETRKDGAKEGTNSNLVENMMILLARQTRKLQELSETQEQQTAIFAEQLARQQTEFAKLMAESQAEHQDMEPKLFKLTESDDIEAFLSTFERTANFCQWEKSEWTVRLAPLLTGKAQNAFHGLPVSTSVEYEMVKAAILSRYNIGEETYKQRFRNLRKANEDTFQVFAVQLEDLFNRWMSFGLNSTDQEALQSNNESIIKRKMLLEQFIDSLSKGLQIWMREQKPGCIMEAAQMADVYYATARNWDKQGDAVKRNADAGSSSSTMVLQTGPTTIARSSSNPKLRGINMASDLVDPEPKPERFVLGLADGRSVQLLLDTGADRTTTRRSCLPENNKNYITSQDLDHLPLASMQLHLSGIRVVAEICKSAQPSTVHSQPPQPHQAELHPTNPVAPSHQLQSSISSSNSNGTGRGDPVANISLEEMRAKLGNNRRTQVKMNPSSFSEKYSMFQQL